MGQELVHKPVVGRSAAPQNMQQVLHLTSENALCFNIHHGECGDVVVDRPRQFSPALSPSEICTGIKGLSHIFKRNQRQRNSSGGDIILGDMSNISHVLRRFGPNVELHIEKPVLRVPRNHRHPRTDVIGNRPAPSKLEPTEIELGYCVSLSRLLRHPQTAHPTHGHRNACSQA
jgi:hypothetical protein